MEADKKRVECPVCGSYFAKSSIQGHVNSCLNSQEEFNDSGSSQNEKDFEVSGAKRSKIDQESSVASVNNTVNTENSLFDLQNQQTSTSPLSGSKSQSAGGVASAWKTIMSNKKQTKTCSATLSKSEPQSQIENTPKMDQCKIKESPKGKSQKGQGAKNVTTQWLDTRITDGGGNPNPSKESQSKTDSMDLAQVDTKPASTVSGEKYKPLAPLAEQMRPSCLQDYIGQDNVVGMNQMLRKLIDSQQIPSMILWGPPGCGKTTLARIIAGQSKGNQKFRFVQLSATTSGIADVKEVIKVAKNEQKMFKRKTILFVDEIHRFNKLQQDTFLPHVEDGTIVLIGATTENPSFQVNNALLSRCRVIVLEKISPEGISHILRRALDKLGVTELSDEGKDKADTNMVGTCAETKALDTLAQLCDGDARVALNTLQSAVHACTGSGYSGVVTVEDIKEGLQRSHVQYDRAGEEHYNCASALQKSIRGSSDSGALYWLARMVEGGEDPLFIARRLVVCASEDIGLADPQALPLAVATFQACHCIGMPECAINLSHCVTYLARAPKSNETTSALQKAQQNIKNHRGPLPGVPLHLRNASTTLMKNLGYGKGYKSNHAFSGPVEQEYLPEELKGTNFFDYHRK